MTGVWSTDKNRQYSLGEESCHWKVSMRSASCRQFRSQLCLWHHCVLVHVQVRSGQWWIHTVSDIRQNETIISLREVSSAESTSSWPISPNYEFNIFIAAFLFLFDTKNEQKTVNLFHFKTWQILFTFGVRFSFFVCVFFFLTGNRWH